MKKVLFASLTLLAAILLFAGSFYLSTDPFAPDEGSWDLCPMVRVDGVLYFDTGRANTSDTDTPADGTITSQVAGSEIPTEDEQSNFGTGYNYRHGQLEDTVEIYSNDFWWIYATEEVKQEMLFPSE